MAATLAGLVAKIDPARQAGAAYLCPPGQSVEETSKGTLHKVLSMPPITVYAASDAAYIFTELVSTKQKIGAQV